MVPWTLLGHVLIIHRSCRNASSFKPAGRFNRLDEERKEEVAKLITMGSAYAVILPGHNPLASSQQLPWLCTECADKPADGLQQRQYLTQLHDSVLNKLLSQLDTRSKCALMCTCTQAQQLIAKQEHWRELAFGTANEQQGLDPMVLFSLLKRSQGSCQVIQLARCVVCFKHHCTEVGRMLLRQCEMHAIKQQDLDISVSLLLQLQPTCNLTCHNSAKMHHFISVSARAALCTQSTCATPHAMTTSLIPCCLQTTHAIMPRCSTSRGMLLFSGAKRPEMPRDSNASLLATSVTMFCPTQKGCVLTPLLPCAQSCGISAWTSEPVAWVV